MSGADPLPVSVVIPAYNRAALLPRAIASIRAQEPAPPAEIIVVDDHSTDDTADVARRLGATVITHEANRGPSAARNTAFAAATQPWLAQLDSDDEWLPNCLDVLWSARGSHALVTAACVTEPDDGSPPAYRGATGDEPTVLTSPAQVVWPGNFVTTSSVLLRRDLVLEVGGYDVALRYGEDLDLWIRLLERGTGVAVPVVTSKYIAHGEQAIRDEVRWLEIQSAPEHVVVAYRGQPWWTTADFESLRGALTWDRLRRDMRRRAWPSALRHAVFAVVRPARLRGIAALLRWREAQRKRSAELG